VRNDFARRRAAQLIVGRPGGKSMILALIAVYLAVFRDWRPYQPTALRPAQA
jgi:hypothetical protein